MIRLKGLKIYSLMTMQERLSTGDTILYARLRRPMTCMRDGLSLGCVGSQTLVIQLLYVTFTSSTEAIR